MLPPILFLSVLVLCNAFFAAAEVALISLKPVQLTELAKHGTRGRILGALSANTGRFLATVQIGVTLAGFLASAFASDVFSDPLAKVIYDAGFTGLSLPTINNVCVVLITVILSYFSLVFGELVPKQIALRYAPAIALNAAIPIHLLARVTAPLVWLLNNSVELVMMPFGAGKQRGQTITEEEIRSLVNMGEKSGLIDADERRIIQNVFELDDITCGEIMTRRGAISAISADDPADEIERRLLEKDFAAYPVYRGTIDNIVGILYATDYFRAQLKRRRAPILSSVTKKPHFVPEGAAVSQVLHDMQREQFEIAVVLDEFGGTAGVVTRDDLLEELVGSLHPKKPEEQLARTSECVWESGGLVRIAEVERELNLELPGDDRPDTVGGLLMAELDDIPKPGDIAEIGGVKFTVQAVDGRRITRVRIELPEPATPDDELQA